MLGRELLPCHLIPEVTAAWERPWMAAEWINPALLCWETGREKESDSANPCGNPHLSSALSGIPRELCQPQPQLLPFLPGKCRVRAENHLK